MTARIAAAVDGVRLVRDGVASPVLSWRWLRDHGEDPVSFNHDTRQRRINALRDEPKAALRAEITGDERLSLTWPEAPESTWISMATLDRLVSEPASSRRLWTSAVEVELSVGEVDQVLTEEDALAAWLCDLATWGVARLSGFDGTTQQAGALVDRIGYVRTTLFGGLWDLASDVDAHDDTAYTQSFLAPHTDGTYSHDAPGLQMFCCTERSGTGGESIIVDGVAIAEDLRANNHHAFDILGRVDVPGHYIEPGIELRAARPAIRTVGDRVTQISLNNYDRSPMLLPETEMAAFYSAYGALQELANDQSRWLSVRLEAGDVLINDNWRVLHGRQAYTGERRFIGCYLNHEDFESRCRTLGVPMP